MAEQDELKMGGNVRCVTCNNIYYTEAEHCPMCTFKAEVLATLENISIGTRQLFEGETQQEHLDAVQNLLKTGKADRLTNLENEVAKLKATILTMYREVPPSRYS